VLRHSGASACRIELADRAGRLELTIADDGVGTPTPPTVRLGGLAGLRDRLAAAGGDLVVDRPGDGFRLVATVPGSAR
jgi:two-component system sensor histidine kinase DesK